MTMFFFFRGYAFKQKGIERSFAEPKKRRKRKRKRVTYQVVKEERKPVAKLDIDFSPFIAQRIYEESLSRYKKELERVKQFRRKLSNDIMLLYQFMFGDE